MYNGPFKWWVQSVMPVVFDDSLSYYEVLAKLTKYIEGLTGDVEQIEKILATIEGIGDVTEFTKFLETIQAEIGNLEDLQTPSNTNLVSAINEVALKADIAYWKPPTGIPESDLSQEVQDKLNNGGGSSTDSYIINNVTLKKAPNNNSPTDLGLGTYSVPEGGIPWDTLSKDVQDRIDAGGGGTGGTKDYTELINKPQINGHTLNAGNNMAESLGIGTYSKPTLGIPESDLSAEVQEKLNTSGDIADSENDFVATRNYKTGDIIYINGVLYRVEDDILIGTTLVPGNNIKPTTIDEELKNTNSEIEDINNKIAGLTPFDSWNLVNNDVVIQNYLVWTRVFSDISMIGNGEYIFKVAPKANEQYNSCAYYIRVCKNDGTVIHSESVTAEIDYRNEYRFTVVPEDTGSYYVEMHSANSMNNPYHYTVTIEYTMSQGITELWNKINEVDGLEPRVDALEDLIEEQQTQLEALEDIPDRVSVVENDVDDLIDAVFKDDSTPPISALYGKYLLPANGTIGNSANWASMRETDAFYVVKGSKVIIDNSEIGNYYIAGAMYSGTPAENTNYIQGTSQALTAESTEYVAPCSGYFWFGVSTNPSSSISPDFRNTIYNALTFEIKKSRIDDIEDTVDDLRAEVDELNEDVEDLKKGDIANSIEATIAGPGYVNGNTGAIVTNHANLSRTDFLDVSFASKITFPQYFSGSSAGYHFYDEDRSPIEGAGGVLDGNIGDEITVNVPNGGYYFVCSVLNANIDSMYINTVFNAKDYIDQKINKDDSPINSPNANDLFSIFKHIGVIGDSLSSGMFNAPANGAIPATTVTRYEYSWIQQIAQRLGLTAYNFSAPGLSTRSWLTSAYPAMLQDGEHNCEAYFIALCHNDYNQELPIGTAADVGTEADTFYGNYSRIIELVQTYAPYSKVFIITAKDETKFAQYNEAIRYMATVYTKNVYVLDMGVYGGGNDVPNWMKTGSHGNAMGYLIYSRWIEAITNWYIYNNSNEFKYVQLIGSSAEENIPDSQKA